MLIAHLQLLNILENTVITPIGNHVNIAAVVVVDVVVVVAIAVRLHFLPEERLDLQTHTKENCLKLKLSC